MVNKNVYKPRYKVAFQSKSIIWPYKNSRLRRFMNIRGRKIIRRGYFKRYVLVFNNMKWAVVRRYIRPYRRRRRFAAQRKGRYRKIFYAKQQMRNFYGKVKENAFRNFFKKFLLSLSKRNNSFFAALERRLDMVVFRMRYLPTIFACNQFVHHYGIKLNTEIETSPHALVNVGDIVSLPNAKWSSIYYYMTLRLFWRARGIWIVNKRQARVIKKKSWWLLKRRRYKKKRFLILKKKWRLQRYIRNISKRFKIYRYTSLFFDNLSEIEKKNNLSYISEENLLFRKLYKRVIKVLKKARLKIKKLKRKKRFLRTWRWKKYYLNLIKTIGLLYSFTSQINMIWSRFQNNELSLYENQIKNEIKNEIKQKKNEKKQKKTSLKMKRKFKALKKIVLLRKFLLRNRYLTIQNKLRSQFFYVLRKHVKKITAKKFYKRYWGNGKKKRKKFSKPNYLIFFLLRRKFKKLRRIQVSRFKKPHWFLPKYIFFDFSTLRGVLLYPPLSKEIYYPFRTSLKKIYSFYKTQGF